MFSEYQMYDIDTDSVLSTVFDDFDQGKIDGIEAYIFIKKLNAIVDGIKQHEDIKNDVFQDVERYANGEKCTRGGFEIKTMTRRNYKFDFPLYNKKKEEIKGLEQQAKALLAQGKEKEIIVDEETGEMIEIKAAELSYSYAVVVSEIRERN